MKDEAGDLSFLREAIDEVLKGHAAWRERWEPFEPDARAGVARERFEAAFAELSGRLVDNYPFFHPSYAGQMLKPPHPAAVAAYLAAMLVNPNNHALDGGPATGRMEKEVVADLARFFGYGTHLGHLTSSGTIANLEALWVSRQLHPDRAVAFSDQAHYTHRRMCEVLGVRAVELPSDGRGRISAPSLRALCLSENIGTVVATVGSTALGALDPLPELLELQREFGFRIHADAAYGGFFRLLADGGGGGATHGMQADDPGTPADDAASVDAAVFRSLERCDSIVVDPHKHGLQPYGCGCVLFRDPSVGRFYAHDSPYTYFTSPDLHLGEISLECSRAGASAAALWLTLRCLPLRRDEGLGPILDACRRAALRWAALLRTSEHCSLLLEPELDILAFFPTPAVPAASAISRSSDLLFSRTMHDAREPVYLGKLRVRTDLLRARYPDIAADAEWTTVLRSTLMKPEHEAYVPVLHERVERAAAACRGGEPGEGSGEG
jgi:glutamate/tyrosine decarboxylase-like PLP-dependent enzyme